jgi:hypothetical protein
MEMQLRYSAAMIIRATWGIGIVFACAALAACGSADSPEQQVRAVIDQMELAAEKRDVGDLTEHLSEDYRDSNGRGPEEVARYLRGYFIANQSIHLLTRIEQLEFPTEGEARVRVVVGMLGRADADRWDLAAELRAFKVALRREQDDWKVSFVEVMPK